jgi:hypothetical protein
MSKIKCSGGKKINVLMAYEKLSIFTTLQSHLVQIKFEHDLRKSQQRKTDIEVASSKIESNL